MSSSGKDLEIRHRREDGAGGLIDGSVGAGHDVYEAVDPDSGEIVAKGSGPTKRAARKDLEEKLGSHGGFKNGPWYFGWQ